MTKSNYDSVDVQDHDGSAAGLYLGGILLTAKADELNTADREYQLLVADGAITIKNGVCKIAKTVAGVVGATLAKPAATTDDYKVLVIINFQAQANTVTETDGFGGGGGGEDIATFTNTFGNTLSLMAYQGEWYIIGKNGVAIA